MCGRLLQHFPIFRRGWHEVLGETLLMKLRALRQRGRGHRYPDAATEVACNIDQCRGLIGQLTRQVGM